jgi:hypothetical protein
MDSAFGWHDIDWGNAAAWLGSLLTSGSLILGFSILRRDHRLRERQHAERLACWGSMVWRTAKLTDYAGGTARTVEDDNILIVGARNTSTSPYFRPHILVRRLTRSEEKQRDYYRKGKQPKASRKPGHLWFFNFGEQNGPVKPTLDPSETVEREIDFGDFALFYKVMVHFGDVHGQFWLKDVRTGELQRSRRLVV